MPIHLVVIDKCGDKSRLFSPFYSVLRVGLGRGTTPAKRRASSVEGDTNHITDVRAAWEFPSFILGGSRIRLMNLELTNVFATVQKQVNQDSHPTFHISCVVLFEWNGEREMNMMTKRNGLRKGGK